MPATVTTPAITKFIAATRVKGTNQIAVNVERNNEPFGQLWTFKAKQEVHPWHAKKLTGEYKVFWGKKAKIEAMFWIAE